MDLVFVAGVAVGASTVIIGVPLLIVLGTFLERIGIWLLFYWRTRR